MGLLWQNMILWYGIIVICLRGWKLTSYNINWSALLITLPHSPSTTSPPLHHAECGAFHILKPFAGFFIDFAVQFSSYYGVEYFIFSHENFKTEKNVTCNWGQLLSYIFEIHILKPFAGFFVDFWNLHNEAICRFFRRFLKFI